MPSCSVPRLPLYMVFYIRLFRGALVDALVSSFLWMAFLNLTTSLPHRSCHSCLGQSATRDSLVWEINLPFVFLIIIQEARGLFGLSLWPSPEDCGRVQILSGLLNCSGGGCCDFYHCRLSCSSPANRARMQKVNSHTSPAKNKITSFPLSVGGLLSLMFGWSHSDALWPVRLF